MTDLELATHPSDSGDEVVVRDDPGAPRHVLVPDPSQLKAIRSLRSTAYDDGDLGPVGLEAVAVGDERTPLIVFEIGSVLAYLR
jgi:hypothetical protein